MPHIHRDYDFTVSAFIVFDAKILLLMHKKLNVWLQPGGHVELNEDPEMALWREIFEETGLKKDQLALVELTYPHLPAAAKRIPIPFEINVHPVRDTPGHQHIDLSFLMKAKTNQIQVNLDESHQLDWFDREGLEKIKDQMYPDTYAKAVFAIQQLTLT